MTGSLPKWFDALLFCHWCQFGVQDVQALERKVKYRRNNGSFGRIGNHLAFFEIGQHFRQVGLGEMKRLAVIHDSLKDQVFEPQVVDDSSGGNIPKDCPSDANFGWGQDIGEESQDNKGTIC